MGKSYGYQQEALTTRYGLAGIPLILLSVIIQIIIIYIKSKNEKP